MKIREQITDFVKLTAVEKHSFFQTLLEFDQLIFPNASVENLYHYVHNPLLSSVYVVQYFLGDQLIGQNIIPVLKLPQNGRPIFVVTSRAGILEQYRHRNLTLKTAIRVVLRHRLRYPAIPLWFVTTLMQPKIYSLFASHSQFFYPRKGQEMPESHQAVLELMTPYKTWTEERGMGIYVAPTLMPKVTAEQLIRLRRRQDDHYLFFIQNVPDYYEGRGLMCICKLDFKTIFETALNVLFGKTVH